jgi:hypothetical protein
LFLPPFDLQGRKKTAFVFAGEDDSHKLLKLTLCGLFEFNKFSSTHACALTIVYLCQQVGEDCRRDEFARTLQMTEERSFSLLVLLVTSTELSNKKEMCKNLKMIAK